MERNTGFYDSLINILTNIILIFRNEKTVKNKLLLFLMYIRLNLKYIFLIKLLKLNIQQEKIFGYNIKFFNYLTLLALFNEIFLQKEYEFNANNKEPFIIDCGSNIGMSICYFKKKYPESKIVGFEPDKKTFQLLKNNVEKNKLGNVELYESAVYNREDTINFYSDVDKDGDLGMSVTKRLLESNRRIKETKVHSVLLSRFIKKPVDLLKIDIEGAEFEVIKELSNSSKFKLINEIIIEYHSKTNKVNKLYKILKILEQNDFKFIIHSVHRPPYYLFKERPYNLIIYAYKKYYLGCIRTW